MVKPKFFKSPFMAVIPQRNYLIDSRLGSNTNNFLMLDETDYQSPKLSLKGNAVSLHGDMMLSEVEAKMKQKNIVSNDAEFIAPDGSRYAKSSTIQEIMRFPFFKLRLDDHNEYHVSSSRAFKQSLSVNTSAEREFYMNAI